MCFSDKHYCHLSLHLTQCQHRRFPEGWSHSENNLTSRQVYKQNSIQVVIKDYTRLAQSTYNLFFAGFVNYVCDGCNYCAKLKKCKPRMVWQLKRYLSIHQINTSVINEAHAFIHNSQFVYKDTVWSIWNAMVLDACDLKCSLINLCRNNLVQYVAKPLLKLHTKRQPALLLLKQYSYKGTLKVHWSTFLHPVILFHFYSNQNYEITSP